jgi:chromosome segregation ATPase
METIKKLIDKPATWMYFILVVALLIIISSNSDKAADVQADLDNAIDEISTLETSLEASANELAVRDDAIAGLNDAIAGLESDSATAMLELNDSDTRRVELEVTVVDLESQLNASASALEDAIANPNCPVAVTE